MSVHPRRVAISTAAAVTVGVLLHFALAWSGRSPLVAVFASLNESVWEHMKLAFWPCLVAAVAQRWIYDRPAGWGAAVFALLPPLLIIVIFYGYVSALGTNYFPLDLATFGVSVLGGAVASDAVYGSRPPRWLRRTAGGVLAVAVVA